MEYHLSLFSLNHVFLVSPTLQLLSIPMQRWHFADGYYKKFSMVIQLVQAVRDLKQPIRAPNQMTNLTMGVLSNFTRKQWFSNFVAH